MFDETGGDDSRRDDGRQFAGRVLLAEDHPVNQRITTVMLESLGFEVDVVADGSEAVNAATQVRYRAILMDCEIPVMNGYEATAAIRRHQGTAQRTPIIAVTASDALSDQERGMAAGMDDYLVKPLTVRTLAAALERWPTDTSTPASLDPAVEFVDAVLVTDPARPVLDPDVVSRLERLGEAVGEDLMSQLAMLFMADADSKVIELHDALDGNDAQSIVRCAHSMSGASGNLGATHLARLFTNLELDGATGDLTRGAVLLDEAEDELERVRAALGSLETTE